MTEELKGYKNQIVLLEQKHAEDNDSFMERLNTVREDSEEFVIRAFGCRSLYGASVYYALVDVGIFSK